MKRSQTLFALLSILCGGLLFASFFLEQPLVGTIGAELLLWVERMLAALLFFSIADTMIMQVRKPENDRVMSVIRTLGLGVFLAVLLLGLIKGPESAGLNRVLFLVQQTLESALAGLVCLSLIFAMYRLPSQAPSAMKISFGVGLVLFLVIYSGLPHLMDTTFDFSNIIAWLESIPQGTLMGLMIGIALGAAITGLRFLFSGKLPAKEDK